MWQSKKLNLLKSNHSQVSLEYMILIGFITFVVIFILGFSLVYSGSVKDSIKMTQVRHFANTIISKSESVFYSGEPSMTTTTCYLPEGVQDINISGSDIYFTIQMSTGITKIAFFSNVPIDGTLTSSSGLKKIKIQAEQNRTVISQI